MKAKIKSLLLSLIITIIITVIFTLFLFSIDLPEVILNYIWIYPIIYFIFLLFSLYTAFKFYLGKKNHNNYQKNIFIKERNNKKVNSDALKSSIIVIIFMFIFGFLKLTEYISEWWSWAVIVVFSFGFGIISYFGYLYVRKKIREKD